MAVTDEEIRAIQLKLMDLEKTVSEIGAALRSNPESAKLGNELAAAKDLITKLNLRLEQVEKRSTTKSDGGDNGNNVKDEWDL